MAHTICFGTWKKSKLGANDDGSGDFKGIFVVDEHSGAGDEFVPITGTHLGRGNVLMAGKCNGEFISFGVEDRKANELICYLNGKLTDNGSVHNINGKFSKPLGATGVDADDDWVAEKTGT